MHDSRVWRTSRSRHINLSLLFELYLNLTLDIRINGFNRTYDEYTSELLSGHLSWSPVHESDMFWKENAIKLNDKDYEQLRYDLEIPPDPFIMSITIWLTPGSRLLIRLLQESSDSLVLAVAAHDLGQYVKHYERRKKYVILVL